MEWYRWDSSSEATANSCLAYINSNDRFPITGRNSFDHEREPDKQKTEKWADAVIECEDGWFGFPRITDAWIVNLSISAEEVQTFLDTFNPTIETYSTDWFPDEEP